MDRYDTGSFKYEQMIKWNPKVVEKKVVPLSVADMEFKTPPEIVDALKRYLDNNILGYTGPTQEYFDAVIGWMKKRHGLGHQGEMDCHHPRCGGRFPIWRSPL